MVLRHNIKDNPQLLGLAKSKVAQLRSTMGKKTKHLSQIIKTNQGLMKLRIAGPHEYAYLLGKQEKTEWLLVASYQVENIGFVSENPAWAVVVRGDSFITTVHPKKPASFGVGSFYWVEPDIPNNTGVITNYRGFLKFEYEDPAAVNVFPGRVLLDDPERYPFQYAHVCIDVGPTDLRKIFINTAFFQKIEMRPPV